MKVCSKCKTEKPLSEFYNDSSKKDGLGNSCKNCNKARYIKYRKNNKTKIHKKNKIDKIENPWKYCLYHIKQRCNNKNNHKYYCYGGRGIECRITADDLKELWFRDKAYLMDRPSIDRKDNDGHYEYSNCQFIELTDNTAKRFSKAVLQFDLNNNFIEEFKSIIEASKFLNISHTGIGMCCKGAYKQSNGFIWRFKNV